MNETLQDLRYAIRSLAKDRRFSLLAILALALGIGAATVIFSAVYGVVLNTFPFKDANQVISFAIHDMTHAGSGGREYLTIPEFLYFRDHSKALQDISGEYGGFGSTPVLYKTGDSSFVFSANFMSVNSFQFFGVAPVAGRMITSDDTLPNAAPTFMMSAKLWKQQFNSDPNLIGKSFVLDGVSRTLTGIMNPRFRWGWAEIWIPFPIDLGQINADPDLAKRELWCVGRLKPGVSLKSAAADLDVLAHQRARDYPQEYPKQFTVTTVRLTERVTGPFKTLLYPLLIAVLLLLLIACSNVANLLLARATVREKEIAVRAAMGASRARLIRQFLVESFVLASAGCVAGCLLAFGGIKVIVPLIPYNVFPQEAVIELNPKVLAFSLALALVSTILCGLAPAFYAMRGELHSRLTGTGKGAGGSFRHERVRYVLVVAQVAFSVVLLIGAGLFMRTFFVQTHLDLGFEPKNVLTAQMSLPNTQYKEEGKKRIAFDQVLRRVAALPGVVATAEGLGIPPHSGGASSVTVPGRTHSEQWVSAFDLVSEGYFKTLGVSLLQGRLLSAADIDAARPVIVVNQSLVHDFFGTDNPIGRSIKFDAFDQEPNIPHGTYFEIIGVVSDVKNRGLESPAMPAAFLPATFVDLGARSLLVKTSLPPESLLPEIRREIWKVDPDIALSDIGSLESVMQRDDYAFPQFEFVTLGSFALIGLALISIGVFSVMSYSVSLKTHEVGIRMALGAQRDSILRMVLKQALAMIAMGIFAGLITSFALTRFLRTFIFGVSPTDPLTFVIVIGCILVVGIAACLLPARRAAAVDPMVALRYE
jgi:putative ABC transport system permease protein